MDGSAMFVLHTITYTLLLQLDLSMLSDNKYIVYAPLVQPLLYQNCDLAPCTITQLSLHTNKKKKSMYKNTVIQQKDSVANCMVAGAMAPFTGQIRTSQEKKIPAQTDSTYR